VRSKSISFANETKVVQKQSRAECYFRKLSSELRKSK